MKYDYIVLISFWIIVPLVLWKIIPRNRIHEAISAFLIFHMLTWLFSIFLTNAGLFETPIRFFKYATKISFTLEYLIFPSFAVCFAVSFPKGAGYIKRSTHYMFWVLMILAFMFLLGTFTNIAQIKAGSLIRSFFNFTIELWICRQFVLWIMTQTKNEG